MLLRIWLLLLLPDRLVSLTVEGPCCIYGRGTHRCVVVFNFFYLTFNYGLCGVRYFVTISFSLIFDFPHYIFDKMPLVQDKNEVQHHISILLFVGLTCGCLMLLFTKFFGSWVLTGNKDGAFIGLFFFNYYLSLEQLLVFTYVTIDKLSASLSLGVHCSVD